MIDRWNLHSSSRSITRFAFALSAVALAVLPMQAHSQTPAKSGNAAQLIGHNTAPQVLDGTATLVAHYNPEQKLRLVLSLRPPPHGGGRAVPRGLAEQGFAELP